MPAPGTTWCFEIRPLVLRVCFTRDMSSQDQAKGWQMPRQELNQPGNPCAAKPRTQVFRVPPLPTCQRYNRRSTTRKLSLRVGFVSGGGVRSDQIRDQKRLGGPAVSQVG